jgi:transposase-like protein
MRNTFKYTARQHWGQVAKTLKRVYQAPNPEAAEEAFAEFEADWGGRYPAVVRLWRSAWEEFTPFLSLPVDIRGLVYTTNAIESLNARFRQSTPTPRALPGRRRRHEGALPCPPRPPAEPDERDRQDQGLEERDQHPQAVLRGPDHP